MVFKPTITLAVLLISAMVPALAQESKAFAEMEQYQQSVKRQAREQAIEEQQNYYCTEELEKELTAALNAPRDPVTGGVTISAYQAWKLEELYKTCSRIKNPSNTTKMLLDAIPLGIKQHAIQDMAAE